ncbi:MAG: T9SS type A sorting domain-containing protein, partial [Candidatus Delongbacteria bacterium]|nr:T9SS type A sorting domain-containing protein [Candidatus Delongbacteria bacterium]
VSKDKGYNWDSIPNPLNDLVYSNLEFIDENGNYMITVGASGSFYIAHKDTLIWRQMPNAPDGSLYIKEYKSCLYSLNWGGVTKSNEDWTEWTKVLEKSNTSQFNAFVVDSIGTVYVGSINPMAGKEEGIYRSFDCGVTWEWYPERFAVFTMAVDKDGRIFAGCFDKILRSTDNGNSWQNVQNLSAWPYCMLINGIDEIYIGASNDWFFGGVAISKDHGDSWQMLNSGLDIFTGAIYDMAESPDGYIYLATDGGVYRSLESTTGINEQENLLPEEAVLYQNYPNPFNNETNISFTIKEISDVRLSVYNIKGEFIKEICDDRLDIGLHEYSFKADNNNSGVYLYRLTINGKSEDIKKMIYLR